jgi:hypothetical protein
LNQTIRDLENLKVTRAAEIASLTSQIERLYLLLAIDSSDRLKPQTKYTGEVVKVLKEERDFLNEEKQSRLPQVIKGARKELAKVCEQLKIPPRMWPRFKGGDPEAEAEFLTQNLQELKQKRIQSQPIIDIISQIEAIRDVAQGKPTQSRDLRGSRRRLADDDRAKKNATEQIHHLEHKLLVLLVEFKEKNGYDFEFNGVNYLKSLPQDTIEGTVPKGQNRKQPVAKKQSLAQQILFEKMNESMALGSERVVLRTAQRRRYNSVSRTSYM